MVDSLNGAWRFVGVSKRGGVWCGVRDAKRDGAWRDVGQFHGSRVLVRVEIGART